MSVFSRIRTEYGDIWSISPYSVQMRVNMDQKSSETDTFHAVFYFCLCQYFRLCVLFPQVILKPPNFHFVFRCFWPSKHFKSIFYNSFNVTLSFLLSAIFSFSIFSQKQPADVFYKNMCSEKFRKIHRKTPLRTPFLQNTSG